DGDTETGGRPVSPGLDRSSRSSPATQSARGGFTPRAQQNGPRSYGDESPSTTSTSSGSRSQPQPPPSALPTMSSSGEMIKVKISYMDDIMAMRIPVSISFNALQQKIFDRLQVDNSKGLSYRDDRGDFALIQSDGDVCDAIDRTGGKLMIYVD
ncbi:SH3 and PX domain-containing protein 2B, partial [Dissophora ornata]